MTASDRDAKIRQYRAIAGDIIDRAIAELQEAGIPEDVAIDRLLTHVLYWSQQRFGKVHTAEQLAQASRLVAAGVFDA